MYIQFTYTITAPKICMIKALYETPNFSNMAKNTK